MVENSNLLYSKFSGRGSECEIPDEEPLSGFSAIKHYY